MSHPGYSDKLVELFQSRTHAGTIEQPTVTATAGVPGQGPYIRLQLLVEKGVVVAARYKTYGCPAAIACAEAACRWAEGRQLAKLAQVTPEQVGEWVEGVPEDKSHCLALTAEVMVRGAIN